MLRHSHRALYAAFDRFPSSKGAATHIARMATGLFDHAGGGALLVLGSEALPIYQSEGAVEIARLRAIQPALIDRINTYQRFVYKETRKQAATLEIAHFRDPWGGIPVLQALEDANSSCRIVYEINGLPSIEWPERYDGVARSTVARLRTEERRCWDRADAIVVPSASIAANLMRLGAPTERITVIPNGADLPSAPVPPRPIASPYFLYFGAIQPWQGLPGLIKAFARLADFPEVKLVICASAPVQACGWIAELAERSGIAQRVIWRHELDRAALQPWITHAIASVAPLTQCARNIDQGCCPLKVLESMAHGIPVVASDLPAVREIIETDLEGVLVPPDRPADLARALRLLLDYPERAMVLGRAARQRIVRSLTWDHAASALRRLYQNLHHLRPFGHHEALSKASVPRQARGMQSVRLQ